MDKGGLPLEEWLQKVGPVLVLLSLQAPVTEKAYMPPLQMAGRTSLASATSHSRHFRPWSGKADRLLK
jgi:hypothetical protein